MLFLKKTHLACAAHCSRRVIQRRSLIVYNNTMADLVVGVIAFGVIYDVSSTLLRKKLPRDIIDPIVIEDASIDEHDKKETKVPAEIADEKKYTDVDFDVREE